MAMLRHRSRYRLTQILITVYVQASKKAVSPNCQPTIRTAIYQQQQTTTTTATSSTNLAPTEQLGSMITLIINFDAEELHRKHEGYVPVGTRETLFFL
ncbi:hypothetical protein KIN20_026666 [Parelaphostrongylus tenuis]|uniref:Uncharacterized protein n=1 Tax=Parelaphostrongylus tenuis TaxID=148309 RepID=A0AAD5QYB1_PARTN|nr:hypothetical protein KIN20_026666 [Parelaphostrongylus tenuis]